MEALGTQEQNLEVWECSLEEVTFCETKGRVGIEEAKAGRRKQSRMPRK